ncbi:MAG: DUF4230 domain-containing protein [Gemmatimonadota bacterium]
MPPATLRQFATKFVVRIALVGVILVVGGLLLKTAVGGVRWPWTASPPKVTHELVVTQIQDVAKLVSTELTLRDVVTFDQSRFGMHRKMLVVVTGKVLAGIDLSKHVDVAIDDRAKHISIALPRAEILGIEVLSSHTYDESAGLLFPFKPEDRDQIQAQTRIQLRAAGEQSGLLPQADRSARQLLESLLAKDGYTVDVTTRSALTLPPRQ